MSAPEVSRLCQIGYKRCAEAAGVEPAKPRQELMVYKTSGLADAQRFQTGKAGVGIEPIAQELQAPVPSQLGLTPRPYLNAVQTSTLQPGRR